MDRIGDSAKKSLDFIKSRARETVEMQKLSATLKGLEERRHSCLVDLGHRVLVCHGTEDLKDEVFQDRVEEVRRLDGRLDEVRAEYEELRLRLRHSMEELLPRKPEPPLKAPDYEEL